MLVHIWVLVLISHYTGDPALHFVPTGTRAECERIAAEEPEGEMLVIGSYSKRLPSEDQSQRLSAARAQATDLAVEFYRHPWERQPPNGNRAGIDKKLGEVAGALFAERHRSE